MSIYIKITSALSKHEVFDGEKLSSSDVFLGRKEKKNNFVLSPNGNIYSFSIWYLVCLIVAMATLQCLLYSFSIWWPFFFCLFFFFGANVNEVCQNLYSTVSGFLNKIEYFFIITISCLKAIFHALSFPKKNLSLKTFKIILFNYFIGRNPWHSRNVFSRAWRHDIDSSQRKCQIF